MKRRRIIRTLDDVLRRRGNPRLQMSLTVLATALSGFVFSALLWGFGVETLWIRYTIAILFAYGVFLLLIAIQVKSRMRDGGDPFDFVDLPGDTGSTAAERMPDFTPGGGQFGGGGATAHFEAPTGAPIRMPQAAVLSDGDSAGIDVGGLIDDPAPLAIAAALAAAFAGIVVAVYMVYAAPTLYAELLLDGALSAGLVRRLRYVDRRHWAETALKRTWLAVAILVLSFGLAGWAIQYYVPEANTLGQFIDRLLG